MSVGQQVCVIYTGVRGYLDAIKPEEVVDFEEKFNEHITTAQAGKYKFQYLNTYFWKQVV